MKERRPKAKRDPGCSRPQPQAVCPAGQRKDKQMPGNVPWPDHKSLEDEYRWREEHIQ